jgi:hypothetical protein
MGTKAKFMGSINDSEMASLSRCTTAASKRFMHSMIRSTWARLGPAALSPPALFNRSNCSLVQLRNAEEGEHRFAIKFLQMLNS